MDRQFLGIVVHPFWDTIYIKGLSKGRYGFVQVLSEPRTRTTRSNSSKQAWEVTSALRHTDPKQHKEGETSRKHSCAKYERGNETGHGGRAKRQEKSSLCMKERKLIDCWIDQEMKFFFPESISLSTIQRNEKIPLSIVDPTFSSSFLPPLITYLFVKDTLTTA